MHGVDRAVYDGGVAGMRGVTFTWNRAYSYFKAMGYQYFFIVNNDILLPQVSY